MARENAPSIIFMDEIDSIGGARTGSGDGGGDSEVQRTLGAGQKNQALFVGYAPTESPQIAIALVVEQGGSGSGSAAPVARKIFDAWLGKGGGDNGIADVELARLAEEPEESDSTPSDPVFLPAPAAEPASPITQPRQNP